MPVKRLCYWQPNPSVSLTKQMFAHVLKCVEDANAIRDIRVRTNIVQYRPILKDENQRVDCIRDFLGISFEEQPDKHFFVIKGSRLVVESDANLPTILDKLQSYRKTIAFSFEAWTIDSISRFVYDSYLGFQYKFGDFQLKLYRASQSESLKAIVLEVEFLPISLIETTRALMDEALEYWKEIISSKSPPGHIFNVEPNFAEYHLSDEYSWQHTAVLYSNAMTRIMAN